MPSHRTAAPRRGSLRRGRPHRIVGVLGLLLLAAAWFLGTSTAYAQTPTAGQVRIGHLSPATPTVDAYVTAVGAAPSAAPVARGVSYGTVSPYLDLAAGRYTVDMRPAGSPAATPPTVSSMIEVAGGSQQSLMFFDTGAGGAVQGEVLDDTRTAGAAGTGLVRVVQAAAGVGPVEIQAAGGPRLASALQYGTATSYSPVSAKAWQVAIVAGTERITATLDVTAGSASSVLVTRTASGALAVTPVVDVKGAAVALPGTSFPAGPPTAAEVEKAPSAPRGGVGAGGGGTAGGPDPLPIVLALGGAVLLVFSVTELRVRRSRHRA